MIDTATVGPPSAAAPVAAPARPVAQGYDRADLDRYLASCAQERASLERELAAARVRIARARSALDAQRVLTSMVSEVCSEVWAKRRQAELVVSRIAATGMDVEAEARLTGRPASVSVRSVEPTDGSDAADGPDAIDAADGATVGAIRWYAAAAGPNAVAVR